ncbi:MAG: deoxyribonuclease V [Chloroflexota bacterium]
MQVTEFHPWQVSTAEARAIQERLAQGVKRENEVRDPGLVAGADISVRRGERMGVAAVVVLGYPDLGLREVQVVRGELTFPYVPGLLTFREAPLVITAWERLSLKPDLLLVDGQGIAHPRRFGLAAHLGLLLDLPTIGCAKSRLCGEYAEPAAAAGSYAYLKDGEEVIGAVTRTRREVKPLFISIGHRVDLAAAIHWTLACGRGHRLPEPTRLAHQAAGGNLRVPEGCLAGAAGE